MHGLGMLMLIVGIIVALTFSLIGGGFLAIIGGLMVLVSNSNKQRGIN